MFTENSLQLTDPLRPSVQKTWAVLRGQPYKVKDQRVGQGPSGWSRTIRLVKDPPAGQGRSGLVEDPPAWSRTLRLVKDPPVGQGPSGGQGHSGRSRTIGVPDIYHNA